MAHIAGALTELIGNTLLLALKWYGRDMSVQAREHNSR